MKIWLFFGFTLIVLAQAPAPQPAAGSLSGRVVNATTGEPVRKATVFAARVDARERQAVSTGNDGEFWFASLAPGDYRLFAQRNGFVGGNNPRGAPSGSSTTATVRAAQTTANVVVKITPAAVITGRVLDDDNEPVLGATVQVLRYSYSAGDRTLVPAGGESTNDMGEYRVFGLAPGKVVVRVVHRPAGNSGQAYPTLYYPNATSASAAAALQLTPGVEMRSIDFRLRRLPAVRISGKVNVPGESRRGGGSVRLVTRDREHAVVGGGGFGRGGSNFVLPAVPPGSYLLEASASSREDEFFGSIPVEVGNAAVENLVVDLAPLIALNGTLRLDGQSSGVDLSKVSVSLRRIGAAPMTSAPEVEMGADGQFQVTGVIPGQYRLSVAALPGELYVKEVRQGPILRPNFEIEVSPGTPTPLDIVLGVNGGQLTGTVAKANGDPSDGATVVLVPDGQLRSLGAYYRSAQAAANGAFTLHGIAPGKYKVFAWDQVESGAWFDPDFLAAYENSGESLDISEGGRETRQLKLSGTEVKAN